MYAWHQEIFHKQRFSIVHILHKCIAHSTLFYPTVPLRLTLPSLFTFKDEPPPPPSEEKLRRVSARPISTSPLHRETDRAPRWKGGRQKALKIPSSPFPEKRSFAQLHLVRGHGDTYDVRAETVPCLKAKFRASLPPRVAAI